MQEVIKELLDYLDYKDQKDIVDQLDHKELLERKEHKVALDTKEQEELKVVEVLQVQVDQDQEEHKEV